jgi:diguanylate cyclase (GGDEF)-like protein/PAS domain S-box-containing protein
MPNFQDLFNQLPDMLFTVDAGGNFGYVNPACILVTGYSEAELTRMNIFDLIDNSYQQIFRHKLSSHLAGEYSAPYEIIIIKRNNEKVLLEFNVARLETTVLPELIITARDVKEKISVRNRLRYLSEHDVLSGLYNRSYFEQEIKRLELEEIVPLSIIICDVNGLKLINDTMGHAQGDRIISIMDSILQEISMPGFVAARIGGDEFAVIMPGADEIKAGTTKTRILNMIKQINKNNDGIYLSVAIGSFTRSSIEQPLEIVLRNADNAMYRAKLFEQMSARHNIISTLESTLSVRDHMTEEHAERMREMALGFGRLIDVNGDDLEVLALLAVTHDIGKIGVPDEVLFKNGPLNDYEWEIMRSHSEIGYRIALESKVLASVADYILHHHEHWDGNGYPLQLKGNDIPLVCRILSIIDAYDAMINNRPYRSALSPTEAIKELVNERGRKFQPVLVDKFIMYLELTQGVEINRGKIM